MNLVRPELAVPRLKMCSIRMDQLFPKANKEKGQVSFDSERWEEKARISLPIQTYRKALISVYLCWWFVRFRLV